LVNDSVTLSLIIGMVAGVATVGIVTAKVLSEPFVVETNPNKDARSES
jgi:hypothetical protein